MLIIAGSNVNAEDILGYTPLYYTIRWKNLCILKLLLAYEAKIKSERVSGGYISLMYDATFSGRIDTLQILIETGVDVNTGYLESSLLHQAVYGGNTDIVKLLIDADSNVNSIDFKGRTPLHIAAELQSLDILKVLLKAGADIHMKNEKGFNPLHEAMYSRNIEVVKLLLDAGSDINSQSLSLETPLHIALTQTNNYQMVKFLIDSGAAVNVKNIKILTQLLVTNETAKRMTHLLFEYIDVNEVNKNGKSYWKEFLRKPMAFRKITCLDEVIIEHIAKLKKLNLHVDAYLFKVIYSFGKYNDYFSKCLQELENMKNIKLHNCWVTFFDLLVDSDYKLVKYAGNEDLVEDVKTNSQQFPVYGSWIQTRVDGGVEDRQLFNTAANILSSHLPVFDPTHLVIRGILDVFSKREWSALCESST